MPIIESPVEGAPLSQGNILKDIKLFESKITANGSEPVESKGSLCLLLSRPCVAAHKSNLVVAEIHKYSPNLPKEVQTCADFLDFLTDTRDGTDSPDVFYLGHVPGHDGRFCARLDQLHTLSVAFDKADFIGRHRIATLNREFLRDLHLRQFRAFASLGFDDTSWFSDEDLASLETYAKTDISKAEAQLAEAKLEVEKQEFRERPGKQKPVNEAQKKLDEIQQTAAPIMAELQRRRQE